METDAYTPDAICRALGVGPFAPEMRRGLPFEMVRLLLCPSFHAELCITFTPAGDGMQIEVAAARTHIWDLDRPGPVTTDRATALLPGRTLDSLRAELTKALVEPPAAGIMIDGMPIHFWSRTYQRTLQAYDNPGGQGALGAFSAAAILLAHGAVDNSRCRNALAVAGNYVSLKLPAEEIGPDEKPDATLVVLGTPDDQAEVLAAIAAVAARKEAS